MVKSKEKILPQFNSTNELVDFFNSNDMGDYLGQMPEANFAIKIKIRKHLIELEQDVVTQVSQMAKTKKISSEALINSWLKEHLHKVS